MDIKKMIGLHEGLVETMEASFRKQGFDKDLINRPVEIHQARAQSVKARIAALADARKDYVARVDADIKALETELKSIDDRIRTERERANPGKKPPAPKRAATKK